MARLEVVTKAPAVMLDGRACPARMQRDIDISLKALGLRPVSSENGDLAVFAPSNHAAAEELYKIFPPEEWEYKYYTVKEYYEKKSSPCLYLDITKNEGPGSHSFDIWELTEEDYNFLRRLFLRAVPGAKIMTVYGYIMYLLDSELTEPRTGSQMDEIGAMLLDLPLSDYRAIRKLIFERRSEYMDEKYVRFDYDKLRAVISDEIVKGLLMRAKERRKE